MRIKRFLLCIVIISLLAASSGCGHTKNFSDKVYEDYSANKKSDNQSKLSVVIHNSADKNSDFAGNEPKNETSNASFDKKESSNSSSVDNNTKKDKTVEYEPREEILNADFTDFVIQVGNEIVRLEYGVRLKDFIESLNQTFFSVKVMYNFQLDDYNPNELLHPYGRRAVCIFADGQNLIELGVYNYEDETVTLENGVVSEYGLKLNDYTGVVYAQKGIRIDRNSPIYSDEKYSFFKIQETLENITGVKATEDDIINNPEEIITGKVYVESRYDIWKDIVAGTDEHFCRRGEYSDWYEKYGVTRPVYDLRFILDSRTGILNSISLNINERFGYEE